MKYKGKAIFSFAVGLYLLFLIIINQIFEIEGFFLIIISIFFMGLGLRLFFNEKEELREVKVDESKSEEDQEKEN